MSIHVFLRVISNLFWVFWSERMIPTQVSEHLFYSKEMFWVVVLVGGSAFLSLLFIKISEGGYFDRASLYGPCISILLVIVGYLVVVGHGPLVNRELSTNYPGNPNFQGRTFFSQTPVSQH